MSMLDFHRRLSETEYRGGAAYRSGRGGVSTSDRLYCAPLPPCLGNLPSG